MIMYAPQIAASIPGFTYDTGLQIPYVDNIAVDLKTVTGMRCIIKNINSSITLETIETQSLENGIATFDILDYQDKLLIGEKYKIQIAYLDDSKPAAAGPYSVVAIGKCCSPNINISIDELGEGINPNQIEYTGIFNSGTDDRSEVLYQSRFYLKENNNILEDTDTGWMQTSAQTEIKYTLNRELSATQIYTLVFEAVTINGLKLSKEYQITKEEDYPFIYDCELKAINNYEDGYIKIYIEANEATYCEFELLRTEDDIHWDVISKFTMHNQTVLEDLYWKDFTIEQGKEYIYALRQIDSNSGKRSEKLKSVVIKADFEDMFLTDGQRQLKIKFNPKVSSFKNTILESKQDTIGGQYPFFFKNQQVKYKEIPIGGLISYLMDDNSYFMTAAELGLNTEDKIKTINLVDYNIAAERKFKLAVLEWLNNGQPKIFRSPTEGNYVVRIMNVSLSPQETLARMLHSFSATGYECMEYSYNQLNTNNLLNIKNTIINEIQPVIHTIEPILFTEDSKTITGNLQNITYISANPDINNTYITVNNEQVYNQGDIINIPQANTMTILKSGNELSSITYYEVNEYIDGDNEFITMLGENVQTYFSTLATGTSIDKIMPTDLNATTIYKYIQVICTPDIQYSDENLYIKINNNKIDLSDGNIRVFKDLNLNTEIEKSSGIRLDIVWKGVK